MSTKPKPPNYDSKLGRIPPEHFDDDQRFTPDPDKSPGSMYDRAKDRLKDKLPPKK